MNTDLHKLKIEKHHKAARDERSAWPWILLVLLLLAAGVGMWQYQKGGSALAVETMRIKIPEAAASASGAGDLVVLNATGYIMAAHKIELASKVIGRVAWVGVEMGDKVEKDQVLVRLEDDEYRARVAQQQGVLDNARARLAELEAGSRPQEIASAEAQLDRSVIEMENAQRVYNRLVEMRTNAAGGRTTSQNEVDDALALAKARRAQVDYQKQQVELLKAGTRKEQMAAQRATVAQLEASLSQAQIDLNNTVIRAPLNATILERNVEVGEFVTTGFVGDRGAKGYVVSIADLNDLLVDLDISQNNFAKISTDSGGQECWVTTDAYPDRKYPGKVERISPVANRQKATVQVRVQILKPDSLLKPDMNATVSFLAKSGAATQPGQSAQRPAIRIPASAMRNRAVFVIEQGKAVRLAVTPGMSTATGEVEIKQGLRGGEDLIVNPPATLKEGDRVATAPPAP